MVLAPRVTESEPAVRLALRFALRTARAIVPLYRTDESGQVLGECPVAWEMRMSRGAYLERSHCLQYVDPTGDAWHDYEARRWRGAVMNPDAASLRVRGMLPRGPAFLVPRLRVAGLAREAP